MRVKIEIEADDLLMLIRLLIAADPLGVYAGGLRKYLVMLYDEARRHAHENTTGDSGNTGDRSGGIAGK